MADLKYVTLLGIGKDDIVAGFVSNGQESVIASLATLSLGAIWTSCSPDFGVQGVLDRFGQTKPKALVAANTTQYNNKTIDLTDRVNGLLVELLSVTSAIIFDGPCPDAKQVKFTPGCEVVAYDEQSQAIMHSHSNKLHSIILVLFSTARERPVFQNVLCTAKVGP